MRRAEQKRRKRYQAYLGAEFTHRAQRIHPGSMEGVKNPETNKTVSLTRLHQRDAFLEQ